MGIILFFFKNVILYFKKSERIALENLLHKFSFRYNAVEKKSILSVPRGLKRSLVLLFSDSDDENLNQANEFQILVLDGTAKDFYGRCKYLKNILDRPFIYYPRSNSPSRISLIEKVMFSLVLIFMSIALFFFSLFAKVRANVGLIPVELVEHFFLINFIKRRTQLKTVIVFCAYEKDIPFLSSYMIQKLKLEVQIVPSSNPIKNFYQSGISSIFTFTLPSQKMEFESVKKSWIYKETVFWPPFGYEDVLEQINTGKKAVNHSIGFFSSGNWLREREKHGSLGLNEREAERFLLDSLRKFFLQYRECRLTIYLHPLEKSSRFLDDSIHFFKNKFGDHVEFAPFDMPSAKNFDRVDLGISVYSSTMFQRLFAEMKVLFAPFTMPYNYFSDIRLESISIRNQACFNETLLKILGMSTADYFKEFNLEEYSFRNYENVLRKGQ